MKTPMDLLIIGWFTWLACMMMAMMLVILFGAELVIQHFNLPFTSPLVYVFGAN